MHVFYCKTIHNNTSTSLNEEESHHCSRVLRLQKSTPIMLIDGKGKRAKAIIEVIHKKEVKVYIHEVEHFEKPEKTTHLIFSPLKMNDKNQWILEKATELGVQEISIVYTTHTERKTINYNRYNKILLTAAKQSMNPFLPILHPMCTWKEILTKPYKHKFIATLHKQNNSYQSFEQVEHAVICIGPEGGFSPKEIEQAIANQWQVISLGNHRLRAETASIFVCMARYRAGFEVATTSQT